MSKIFIKNLRVEHLSKPLGVDKTFPRFSWQIVAKESQIGITQINTLDCVYVLSTDEGYLGAVLEFQDVNFL